MNADYIKNNYKIELLNPKHDLSTFDCGSDDLNEFLKLNALHQQKQKLNVTHLVTCNNTIIGFFSLLSDTISIKVIENNEKSIIENKLPYSKTVPAVKIGRLALDKKYSKQGIGSHILRNIIYTIKKISETYLGIRFIVVEAYAQAYNFYVEKNKFKSLKKDYKLLKKLDKIIERDPERTFYLYLDLTKIRE